MPTTAASYYHSKEHVTVMAKDGSDFFEAMNIDQLHLPNLNKISKTDQKAYSAEIKKLEL